jgi:TPR repeat protein
LDFRAPANTGHGGTASMLAVMHQQGLGVAVNYKRAPIAHLRTTKLGDTTVLYNLAEFHQLGNGVTLNDAATRKWHLTATQRHPKTQNNLGATYYIGAGVAQDLVEAWKCLALAANRLRDQYRTATLSNRTHALRKI